MVYFDIIGEFMKQLTVLFFTIITTISVYGETCRLDVNKTTDNLLWSSEHGINKFLLIKNLDNNMIYPQMLTSSTSGSLSSKLLEPNNKGYKLLLVDITENTKNQIDSLLINCSKKKNCSMEQKDIKVKKTKCNILSSDVIK